MKTLLQFILSLVFTVAFATAFSQADTLIFEDMDNGVVPVGWDTHFISMETPASGGYARFEDDSSYMETPVLDLTNYTDVTLTFQVAKWGSGGDGPLTVSVSDDGGVTWTAQTYDSPVPVDANYLQSGPDTITATGANVKIKISRPSSSSRKRLQDVLITGIPDSSQAPATPVYSVDEITGNDAGGQPDSLGVHCWTSGVVLGVNTHPGGLQFTVWDSAGISAYSGSDDWGYSVQEGDSVMIRGTVGQVNGLTQMSLDSVVHVNSGNPVPAPNVVTDLDETSESEPVQLNNLEVLSVGSGSEYGVEVTNGDTNFIIFISAATQIDSAVTFQPGDSLCYVAGIGSQHDTAAPYFDGYLLQPRYTADIDTSCGTQAPGAVHTYPIGDVTTTNTDGIADSSGVYCAVEGVVYGIDLRDPGHRFTIIDETGGISVFSTVDVDNYQVEEGDEIRVTGEIEQYNGQIRIQPDSITVLSTGNCIPFPDLEEGLGEHTESRYIQLRNVTLVDDSNFPDVDIMTLSGDSLVLRVDTATEIIDSIQSPPAGLFHVTGIGGQDDATVPHNSGYFITPIYARDIDEEISKPAPDDLYINEVMADNQTVIADDNGAYSGWIEVYNGSGSDIDLAGEFVSSDPDNEMMYRIPRCHENQTTVSAGGFTLIRTSAQEETGALYTGFELDNGGFAGLYTADGNTPVDSVSYGELAADHSFGREDDGAAPWVTFHVTTPGESNANGEIVSVRELSGESELTAYPNPVSNGVLRFSEVTDVAVYDAAGKRLIAKDRVRELNVESLSSGFYLVKAGKEVFRVVVE